MRVIELAQDLKVEAGALIHLLREMGIPVTDEDATITDGQVAKVLARVERERRAGRKDPAAAGSLRPARRSRSTRASTLATWPSVMVASSSATGIPISLRR